MIAASNRCRTRLLLFLGPGPRPSACSGSRCRRRRAAFRRVDALRRPAIRPRAPSIQRPFPVAAPSKEIRPTARAACRFLPEPDQRYLTAGHVFVRDILLTTCFTWRLTIAWEFVTARSHTLSVQRRGRPTSKVRRPIPRLKRRSLSAALSRSSRMRRFNQDFLPGLVAARGQRPVGQQMHPTDRTHVPI